VLALAKQIASIGGNAQDALQSGTFKPGNLNDNTGKGNTCDDANDTVGCIISQKLIVNDATAAEINAAVGAKGAAAAAATAPAKAAAAPAKAATEAAATPAAAATGGNQQKFTGALGGAPPPVVPGGKGFIVDNSQFINLAGALGRSCDVQHNACSAAANSKKQAGLTSVSQCDAQNTQCHALIKWKKDTFVLGLFAILSLGFGRTFFVV
jgi:hypothetical protein